MENRSQALWAGLFTLGLIAAAVAAVIWLNRDRHAVEVYEILSSSPVSGLSAQSTVRFQGVPVGRVRALVLDPAKPGQVRIQIAVSPGTPITAATWAELGTQGITGLGLVELRDEGNAPQRLTALPGRPVEIPLRPGLLARFEEKGAAALNNLDQIAGQIKTFLSPDNAAALARLLQNAAEMSTRLKDAGGDIGPMVDGLKTATRQMGETARATGELMHDVRDALAKLTAAGGPLTAAMQGVREITRAAEQIRGQTLPAISGMAGDVSTAARGVSTMMQRVGEQPQSLLFGLPTPAPGPGEKGFSGYGAGR